MWPASPMMPPLNQIPTEYQNRIEGLPAHEIRLKGPRAKNLLDYIQREFRHLKTVLLDDRNM